MNTNTAAPFQKIRVVRRTGETAFTVTIAPRTVRQATLPLANRLLSHFLDHFSKSSRLAIELDGMDWPGSWQFDHVLCEDMGQLVGRGVAAIQEQRSRSEGVAGRGHSRVCMDDALVEVVLSLESRPRAEWLIAPSVSVEIDGFVDAWYADNGRTGAVCFGANLRQFVDGFAFGSGATVVVNVQRAGNLHHMYECVFRALGETVASVLGLTVCVSALPGDSSGLAGVPEYIIEPT